MTYSRWALGDGASYAEKKARSSHPAHQRGTLSSTTNTRHTREVLRNFNARILCVLYRPQQ